MSDTNAKKLPAHELLVQHLDAELTTIRTQTPATTGAQNGAYTRAALIITMLNQMIIPANPRSDTIRMLNSLISQNQGAVIPLLAPLVARLQELIIELDKPDDA